MPTDKAKYSQQQYSIWLFWYFSLCFIFSVHTFMIADIWDFYDINMWFSWSQFSVLFLSIDSNFKVQEHMG